MQHPVRPSKPLLISVKSMLLTGHFGPVSIGMHRDEIISILGPADAVHDFGTGSCALNYGYYELFCEQESGRLNAFQNDHLLAAYRKAAGRVAIREHKYRVAPFNACFRVDASIINVGRTTTRREMRMRLRTAGIPFTETLDLFKNRIFRFESGVTMDFVAPIYYRDHGGPLSPELEVLNGIRYFPLFHQ